MMAIGVTSGSRWVTSSRSSSSVVSRDEWSMTRAMPKQVAWFDRSPTQNVFPVSAVQCAAVSTHRGAIERGTAEDAAGTAAVRDPTARTCAALSGAYVGCVVP